MDTLIVMLGLLTGHVDADRLRAAANQFSVPPPAMFGVAWEESRDGRRGNNYRGPGEILCDSICRKVCREVGRMQIKPCFVKGGRIFWIDWSHLGTFCQRDSVRVSHWANVRCGAAILRHKRDRNGTWEAAITAYNGSGKAAREYSKRVLSNVGLYTMRAYD